MSLPAPSPAAPAGPFAEWTLARFLEATSAKSPTPGGGSVASILGAHAAALAQMVVSYSLGKKALAPHEPALQLANLKLTQARAMLLQLAEEDARAYGQINALMKLPETDPRRLPGPAGTGEWAAAAKASIEIPRSVLALAMDLLRLSEELAPITNKHLRSDLAIAAVIAEACARSSVWNTRINLSLDADRASRAMIEGDLERSLIEAAQRRDRIERACAT
jgi:methenyltetrahydrofolate cyclohydrolase